MMLLLLLSIFFMYLDGCRRNNLNNSKRDNVNERSNSSPTTEKQLRENSVSA
jgi:hypothetical protein